MNKKSYIHFEICEEILGIKVNCKALTSVLLAALLLSGLSGLVEFPAATAQSTDTFMVSVSCSEVMRLRGQNVNIFTVTNASSFRQEIVSPSGTVLYYVAIFLDARLVAITAIKWGNLA